MAQDIQTSSNGDPVAVTGYVAFGHYQTRPYSVLELCRAEITCLLSLYSSSKQFQENYDICGLSTSQ